MIQKFRQLKVYRYSRFSFLVVGLLMTGLLSGVKYLGAFQRLELAVYDFKTLTATGWKEQFGHVLIEAMACRVAVVGSDSGEIPHVIQDTGLVFPEGQADQLADRLRQLIEDPQLHEKLAQAGYDRAMAQYTNRALAKALLAFYRTL
ncbi:MAG: glycosyltransferase family 4 protein [Leptolyngbya sp. SIO4C1]|nr:glycosyltransferase family 4 protein [Leptolyngbya sp. SIO4C1]